MKKTLRKGLAYLLAVSMIITFIPMAAFGEAGQVPEHSKSVTANDDGTFTIALNVKGDSVRKVQKVNVIVVVDRSGSMGETSGTSETAYTPTNSTQTGLYGLIEGEYVPLERRGGDEVIVRSGITGHSTRDSAILCR